jgi:16S rRNA (uracil1498-N3)-methyltransferase
MRLWDATGPHFFVAPADVDGGQAILRGDQARHLAVVLRARPGMAVSLADGVGARFRAQVAAVDPDGVRLEILDRETVSPPRPSLTVVHALPKGRKLDEVVEKLSEIGVDRLVPVHSARSQVRLDAAKAEKARARWEAVALAAGKQSRRVRPLRVEPVADWATAFGAGPGVVLYEEAEVPLRARLAEIGAAEASELVLAIGPEGGLTPEEVAACGLPAATLGSTILRTETAALAAAAATLTLLGRFA